MINVIQNDDLYEISFPYDEHMVFLVKNVPGRRWVPDRKVWTIPLNHLGLFINQIKGTPYQNQVKIYSNEHINENATLDVTTDIPDIDISDVVFKCKEGSTPYKHQLEFMKYAINRQRHGNMSGFLLCDEQGLGKSASCMNLAIYNRLNYKFKRCLIICCVNSTKYHWLEDIEVHTGYKPYLLGTRKYKRDSSRFKYDASTAEKLEDLKSLRMYGEENGDPLPFFVVMNIEAIRGKSGKYYAIADRLIELINEGEINMICIDEVHKNMHPSSTQGKQLLRIKKKTGTKAMWIPITGTPIVNKPTDVFLPLKLVDGHGYKDFWNWCQRFCIYGGYGGYEIEGYKNIPELKEMLQKNMIRRLKKDVLDLPPKLFYTEYVENTAYQKRLYKNVAEGIIKNKESIISSLNPLSQMMRLRQVNGSPEIVDEDLTIDNKNYVAMNAKMTRLLELLEEIVIERGEKVLIFSNWVEPLRTIYKFISKKYYVRCYTGTMKETDRQKHKKQFIENPIYKIMLGTVGAMGVSHTFTVANNIIFYDEPWTVADFDQCCDRCHRISTTNPVNIYTLITKDTIDERVDNILYKKRGVSSYIVDNIDIHSNPELFDLLLSDSIKHR